MRVAVCLSGLVRTYRDTYSNLLTNLITPNPQCQFDFFISTWPIEHSNNSMERTRRLSWYGDQSPPFPETGIDYLDLQTKYQPVMLMVEQPRLFLLPEWYQETPGLHIQSILSMTYKIYAVDLLRRQHETLSGFVYDRVIRHRFDTLVPMPLALDDLPGDRLVVPSMMQPRWDPDLDWTNDKFAIGTAEHMTIYSNWYLSLAEIVGRGTPIQPEIMLFNHLTYYGVPFQELGAEFEMVRIPGF